MDNKCSGFNSSCPSILFIELTFVSFQIYIFHLHFFLLFFLSYDLEAVQPIGSVCSSYSSDICTIPMVCKQ